MMKTIAQHRFTVGGDTETIIEKAFSFLLLCLCACYLKQSRLTTSWGEEQPDEEALNT